MKKHLIILTSVDLVRIPPESVVYIESDGNYSIFVQLNGERRMLTFQLGQIEKMIALHTDGLLIKEEIVMNLEKRWIL